MNRYSRLALAVIASVVLTAAASLVTWRVVAGSSSTSGVSTSAATFAEGVAAPPVPGGPTFLALSSVAFRSTSSYSPYFLHYHTELSNGEPGGEYYLAPVLLPHGVTVTKLVAYFFDMSTPNDLTVELLRVPSDGSGKQAMATVHSWGIDGYSSAQDNAIDYPVIDLQSYAYVAEAYFPGADIDLRLVNVRIDYGYGVSLPLVTKQD